MSLSVWSGTPSGTLEGAQEWSPVRVARGDVPVWRGRGVGADVAGSVLEPAGISARRSHSRMRYISELHSTLIAHPPIPPFQKVHPPPNSARAPLRGKHWRPWRPGRHPRRPSLPDLRGRRRPRPRPRRLEAFISMRCQRRADQFRSSHRWCHARGMGSERRCRTGAARHAVTPTG